MGQWTDVAGSYRTHVTGKNRRVHSLLEDALRQVASHSRRYFEATDDLAFGYRESQFHSVLVPALTDLCEVVFREQPLQRKPQEPGEAGGYGQLDYWLERRGRTTLLELKHQHISLRSRALNTWFWGDWVSVQGQLDTLMGHGGRDLLPAGAKADVVGLMVSPYYMKGRPGQRTPTSPEALWKIHEALAAEVAANKSTRHHLGWSALWLVPEDMRRWGDHYYPAVSWFAALPERLRVK